MDRKEIFKKALENFNVCDEMVTAVEALGVQVELGSDKPLAKVYDTVIQNSIDMAIEAMDLELKKFNGDRGFTVYVYYPREESEVDVSVEESGMMAVIETAAKDEKFAELVWDCFVNKNEEAKRTIVEEYEMYGFSIEE